MGDEIIIVQPLVSGTNHGNGAAKRSSWCLSNKDSATTARTPPGRRNLAIVPIANPIGLAFRRNRAMIRRMDLLRLIWCAFVGLFRSKASLEAENLVLRQ